MNKLSRKLALEIIKVEYRKHGEITPKAILIYTENNISWKAVMQAIDKRYLT